MTDPAIPPLALDAHHGGMRTIEHRGHRWTVVESDGRFGFVVGHLPAIWIDAPCPLEELSDQELLELVRSELEPRGDAH